MKNKLTVKIYLFLFTVIIMGLSTCTPGISTPSNTLPQTEAQSEESGETATITSPITAKPLTTSTVTPGLTNTTISDTATVVWTATPIPTRTPSPTSTPLPEIWANSLISSDNLVAWSVPVGWQQVTRLLPTPTTQTHFWQAWANQADEYPIFTPSSSPRNGLMLLTLRVELDEGSSSEPVGVETQTSWGQTVWVQEISGSEVAPFTLRLALSTVRDPYQYHLTLDCASPESSDMSDQDASIVLCRHVWNVIFPFFGLCAKPTTSKSELTGSHQVSDDWYQYAFEIPSDWLILEGPTADRLNFFSDVGAYGQPNVCPLPNGLMKLDFAVDAPGNFGTGEPGSGPDLEGFTAITVADYPAWIKTIQGGEAMGPLATVTAVYIQGPQFWYTFWLSCTPPTDADPAGQTWFKLQCEEAVTHILNSFQILESE